MGNLAERWTGWALLDLVVTGAWSAAAVYALAPRGSYRHRDAVAGLVPLVGWYLTCVLSWRVALLPYRDWEPRPDELWRARWLTGDLVGFWRSDPLPAAARPRARGPRGAGPEQAGRGQAGRGQAGRGQAGRGQSSTVSRPR
jgi:hypothetical protein